MHNLGVGHMCGRNGEIAGQTRNTKSSSSAPLLNFIPLIEDLRYYFKVGR